MRKIFFFTFLNLLFYNSNAQLARGADIGWLTEMEQSGRIWRDSLGVQRDLLDILDDYCVNSIRLRVWVNPANGWSGKQDVINLAKRAHAKGYRLMIDFHYSDSWADPGQQTKPAAWANFSITQIKQAIYDHTVDVLKALKAENITPEWVQVGNETNDGMIWPEGRASSNNNANMVNYAAYVDKGYEAVKSVFPNTKVVVHVANGFDNGLFRWNIGGLVNNGARFDVIGMSMYPDVATDWSSYASQTMTNMQDIITRYNKEIIVSEIGLATSNASDGKAFVEKVIQNLQSLPNKKGLGVFWWEPQAYNWRGYGKVAWNSNTASKPYQATDAMKGFKYGCSTVAIKDCFGTPGGTAFLDNCKQCVGGLSGKTSCKPVNVSFKLDMTGQNVSNGVYITGAMTAQNGNWQIVSMTNAGNNIYTYTKSLYPTDTATAYYYLNGNNWTSREQVPVACASAYGTDRSFMLGNKNQEIQDTWASCKQIVTGMEDIENKTWVIFPNPSQSSFELDSPELLEYQLINLNGNIEENGSCIGKCRIGNDLANGLYLLKISQEDRKSDIIRIEKL